VLVRSYKYALRWLEQSADVDRRTSVTIKAVNYKTLNAVDKTGQKDVLVELTIVVNCSRLGEKHTQRLEFCHDTKILDENL